MRIPTAAANCEDGGVFQQDQRVEAFADDPRANELLLELPDPRIIKLSIT
jgi:hypothetical protein